MRRSAALLLLLWGCSAPRLSSDELVECFTIDDCYEDYVCFLGRCVSPGYNINAVYAEAQPPNTTPWLSQQIEAPLSVADGFLVIQLRNAATLEGTVAMPESTDNVPGILTARRPGAIRDIQRQAVVSADNGFSLRAIPGEYELRFLPASMDLSEEALPPIHLGKFTLHASHQQHYAYPAAEELVHVIGRVLFNSDVSTPVGGAMVTATAVSHEPPLQTFQSTVAVTESDGTYHLTLPPKSHQYNITVRPGSNLDVPELTREDVQIVAPDENRLAPLELGIEQIVPVHMRVLSQAGAPVEGATVVFSGQVGEGNPPGKHQVMASSFPSGDVGSSALENKVQLLSPGNYTITVVPRRNEPYALLQTSLQLPADPEAVTFPFDVHLHEKITVSGTVRAHGGGLVRNARITFTLRHSEVARQVTATTNVDGWYSVALDPSTPVYDAEYELVVEPEWSDGLPRYRELFRLGQSNAQRNIRLHAPSFMHGMVQSPQGDPVADAVLMFYASELGSASTPLLVGVGQSNEHGEFVVPIPNP